MRRRDCLKRVAAGLCAATFADSLLPVFAADRPASPAKKRLRIVSYNIQIGRGPGGSYDDPKEAFLDRTAKAISALNPDIAGLQEVDQKTNRSGADVDQLAELARLTEREGLFAPKIELPGGKYGVGVLTREKPIRTASVLMRGASHTRVLQICEFDDFVFFNTHFPLTEETRLEAVKTVELEARRRADKPIFLVGDINATPDERTIAELKENWTIISPDGPTFPADAPESRIDFIFVRNAPTLRVVDGGVANEPVASDHRPVWVDVEF